MSNWTKGPWIVEYSTFGSIKSASVHNKNGFYVRILLSRWMTLGLKVKAG